MKIFRLTALFYFVKAQKYDYIDQCLDGYERVIGVACDPPNSLTHADTYKTLSRAKKVCDEDYTCKQFAVEKLSGEQYSLTTSSSDQALDTCVNGNYKTYYRKLKNGNQIQKLAQYRGCKMNKYKKLKAKAVQLCPNDMGTPRVTLEECQSICNKAKECFGFKYEYGRCKFIGSTDTITINAPFSDLYVKECLDVESLAYVSPENITETLQIAQMVLETMYDQPDRFYSAAPQHNNLYLAHFKRMYGFPIAILTLVCLITIFAMCKPCVDRRLTNCQKCSFVVPISIVLILLLLVTFYTIMIYNGLDFSNAKDDMDKFVWDCKYSNHSNSPYTCWADQAFDVCNDTKVFNSVIEAGGSNKESYELYKSLQKTNCGRAVEVEVETTRCDRSKASCDNSMYPEVEYAKTCWADTIYEKCPNSEEAYDAVMSKGGYTEDAYCFYEEIMANNCSID